MRKAKMTQFGKDVRKALIDADSSVPDLAAQVAEKTGLFCDSSYLYHIFRGDRNPPKIKNAIREILNMEERKEGST